MLSGPPDFLSEECHRYKCSETFEESSKLSFSIVPSVPDLFFLGDLVLIFSGIYRYLPNEAVANFYILVFSFEFSLKNY